MHGFDHEQIACVRTMNTMCVCVEWENGLKGEISSLVNEVCSLEFFPLKMRNDPHFAICLCYHHYM